MDLLVAEGIKVVRGGKVVVEVEKFVVRSGETVALIGPNGSGKTTLLMTLATLLKPMEGKISFKGELLHGFSQALHYRRQLACVFQEPLLLDTTVFHNIALGLKIRGMPGGEIKNRVENYADLFNITPLLHRRARKLSSGEAQRVSLARAFVLEPEILFLDEPFANLDAPSREVLIDDLACILKKKKVAALFATHDRSEAVRFADRMAVMTGGKILQIGSCEEVLNHPINEQVASFVGMDTTFWGKVVSVKDGSALIAVSQKLIEIIGYFEVGDIVFCGIRPEQVILSQSPLGKDTSIRNNLPATVVEVSPRGSFYKVTLDCGFPLTSYVTTRSLEELSVKVGMSLNASFKATAVHVMKHGRP